MNTFIEKETSKKSGLIFKNILIAFFVGVLMFVAGCKEKDNSPEVSVEVLSDTNIETDTETDNTDVATEDESQNDDETTAIIDEAKEYMYGINGKETNYETAYNMFKDALDKGNNDANLYLGILCDFYNYPEKDYKAAMEYYEACGDNPLAKLCLGFMNYSGKGCKIDLEKAESYFNEAKDDDIPESSLGLALLADYNEDYGKAAELYNKVIDEGKEQVFVAYAINNKANFYYTGDGDEKDLDKAIELYKEAADMGSCFAMINLSYAYRNGNGVDKNYDTAIEWIHKAMDMDHPGAYMELANLYADGNGVDKDDEKATELYQKCVELGNYYGLVHLGYLYYDKDSEKAIEYFQQAIDMGYNDGVVGIGFVYSAQGNDEKSFEYFLKAAEQGNLSGMYETGLDYFYGIGVSVNKDEAVKWWRKAAEKGHPAAKESLEDNGYSLEESE